MKSFKKEKKNSTTQAIIKSTEPIFCDFGKSKTVPSSPDSDLDLHVPVSGLSRKVEISGKKF